MAGSAVTSTWSLEQDCYVCGRPRHRCCMRTLADLLAGIEVLMMNAIDPVQGPPLSAVASGRWGPPVAGVMWPTVEGHALPASAIEASSTVAATKLGGGMWASP